jgi:hypothetical protein
VGIGPAGDVWVTNNWQYPTAMWGKIDEALQTLGAGQGASASLFSRGDMRELLPMPGGNSARRVSKSSVGWSTIR